MIREINRDLNILKQISVDAKKSDQDVIQDLRDTFMANQSKAVGMAANMIGINKRIIIVQIGMFPIIMINPIILKKAEPYQTKEGCLSLIGEREVQRFQQIEVEFLDINFNKQKQTFSDFVAEIIQHEVDHCNGIII